MSALYLPYVKMPVEFSALLKANLGNVQTPSAVFDVLRPNRALYRVLEVSLKEYDDGSGVEKLVTGLGWPNFRERMASLYIYKSIFGEFPSVTSMDLVEDIKTLEATYRDFSVHGHSRLFLLGLYIRLANIQIQQQHDGKIPDLKLPPSLHRLLKLSQGHSEKIDWLILILMHLTSAFGEDVLSQYIRAGKKMEELYELLAPVERETMHRNLLAYAASIYEPDFFLYEKV